MDPDFAASMRDIAMLDDLTEQQLDMLHRHVNAGTQRGYARAKREAGRPTWFEFSLLVAGCFIGQLFSSWWLG